MAKNPKIAFKMGRATVQVDRSGKNDWSKAVGVDVCTWLAYCDNSSNHEPVSVTSAHELEADGWAVTHIPSGAALHKNITLAMDAKNLAAIYIEKCRDNPGYLSSDKDEAKTALTPARKKAVKAFDELVENGHAVA